MLILRKTVLYTVIWIFLYSLGTVQFIQIEFKVLSSWLNPIAQHEFEGWHLSQPFQCVANKAIGNLECLHVLLPSNVRGVSKYADVEGAGYNLEDGDLLIFPLEYIAMCSDHDPERLCIDEFTRLEDHCVAWTALDNTRAHGKGEIYLIVNCWGYRILFSMDHDLGHSVPLGRSA